MHEIIKEKSPLWNEWMNNEWVNNWMNGWLDERKKEVKRKNSCDEQQTS